MEQTSTIAMLTRPTVIATSRVGWATASATVMSRFPGKSVGCGFSMSTDSDLWSKPPIHQTPARRTDKSSGGSPSQSDSWLGKRCLRRRDPVPRGQRRLTAGYRSVGPMSFTRPEPAAFNFKSVVRSRHFNNCASARYSAS